MDLEPDQRRALLRASDTDREETVAALRQHHSDGRLTIGEFTERMEQAYTAKTYGDLAALTADLPPQVLPEPSILDPAPRKAQPVAFVTHRRNFMQHLLAYVWVNGFMISLWALGSVAGRRLLFFWPVWTLVGWGFALGCHSIRLYGAPHARLKHSQADAYGNRRRYYDRWSAREHRRHRSSRYHR